MSKDSVALGIKSIFLSIVVIAAITLAFFLAFNDQRNSAFLPVSLDTGIAWAFGAIILSFTVIFVLRITKVSWFWSVLGGTIIIVIYSTFMIMLFATLEEFLRGWIFG